MADVDGGEREREAGGWFGEGNARMGEGDWVGAARAYLRAVELWPGMYEAYCNGGVALRRAGLRDAAIEVLRGAVGVRPGGAEGWCNLGVALEEGGRVGEAVECFRRAVEVEPGYGVGWFNLGNGLRAMRRWGEAVGAYREAVRVGTPGVGKVYSNLGMALKGVGDLRGAVEAYSKAVELEPGAGEPRWNRALAHLALGEWELGWGEFEWRNRVEPPSERPMEGRRWGGEEIRGKRLMVNWEMGLGDTLQFVRFVPVVAERFGARVVVECQGELVELLRGVEGVGEVVGPGEGLPGFDVGCSVMSLAGVVGVKSERELVGMGVPYLRAEPGRAGVWGGRLKASSKFLVPSLRARVGLVWAGRAEHANDAERSVRLEVLGEFGRVEGVEFYSLQMGEAGRQVGEGVLPVVDWTGEIRSMADTAGLIANLDLVISVDTAVAHLAGAMGKEVWVLLAKVADWRWGVGREDSPWYPTMRLFRQEREGDWKGVVRRVRGELERWVGGLSGH